MYSPKTKLQTMLGIDFPLILAPMFLVSNEEMIIQALESGISGCLPAHNYRSIEALDKAIKSIQAKSNGPIGINLIVNKSNVLMKKQLHKCLDLGISYFITSLGSPEEVIKESKSKNIKVFCDVIDLEYSRKVQDLGADALIAVNSGAGGHLGKIPATVLIPLLKKNTQLPVISAGGVGSGAGILSMLILGADGISMGSPFIATKECPVANDYKNACVEYGAKDIVVTTKLSGTPCTVINTPYVKRIGTDQNMLERLLNQNKQIKKYAKMITYYKGMKSLEKAAFKATYQSVWCAGSSIEFTKEIETIQNVVQRLKNEFNFEVENVSSLWETK